VEIILPECKKKITLKKPTAGQRNDALIKAEIPPTADSPGGISQVKLMIELLPHCIQQHEFGTVPIKVALDNLSFNDYDFARDSLADLMTPSGDVQKKSETPSE
jgi:hypothetical protein